MAPPVSVTDMPITQKRGKSGGLDGKGVEFVRKYMVDTEEEAMACGPAEVFGFPKDGVKWSQEEQGQGRLEVTVTYKGAPSTMPGLPQRDKAYPIWSGKVVVREEPVVSCPFLSRLLTKYEGKMEMDPSKKPVIVWPEFLNAGTKGNGFGTAAPANRNPMYGAKTYPVLEGEVTATYIHSSKTLPGDLYDRVGRILKNLVGNTVPTPKDYVWIVMTPEFEAQGQRAWKIKQPYRLTHQDSYTAIIHDIIRR